MAVRARGGPRLVATRNVRRGPHLRATARFLSQAIRGRGTRRPPLIAANGDRVVMTLLRLLQESGKELGPAFRPLAREAYGLLVRAKDLGDRGVVRVCEVAQSERFRDEVDGLPGYHPTGAGDIKYDGA